MNLRLFTEPGTWNGGFYGMKMFVGTPSDRGTQQALSAIWSSPRLIGPYGSRDAEPWEQQRIEQILEPEEQLFGIARIPPEFEVPCGTLAVRETDANGSQVGDFVSLYTPLCALALIFPVGGYPFGNQSEAASWRPQIDKWFLSVLEGVAGRLYFEVCVIGWEPELNAENIEKVKAAATAVDRYDGIILPRAGGISWYPPTRSDLIPIRK
jgi:hypothetical protein